MDTIQAMQEKEFLGNDFLLWLWFKSSTNQGDVLDIELSLSKKIILKADDQKSFGTISCSGSGFKEARHALADGYKITSAGITLVTSEEEAYSFTLDSMALDISGLKCPKVVMDDEEDPDGLFYEKIGLISKVRDKVEMLFKAFIELRLSGDWIGEFEALSAWVRAGKDL